MAFQKYLKYKYKYFCLRNKPTLDWGNGDKNVKQNLALGEMLSFEGMNEQDWMLLQKIYHPDVYVEKSNGEKTHGFENHLNTIKEMYIKTPDLKFTSHEVQFGSGNWTAVVQNLRGTNDGKIFYMKTCSLIRWIDGRILEQHIYFPTEKINMNAYLGEKYGDIKCLNLDGNVNTNLINICAINFEGYNKQDWGKVSSFFDKNITSRFSDGTIVEGLDKNMEFMKSSLNWSSDFKTILHKQFGSGNWTAVSMYFQGTFTGELELSNGETIKPTGEKIKMNHCSLGYWESGKLKESWIFT